MQPSTIHQLLLQLALAALAFAQCNQDNCYRAFAQKTSSVSAFCSTYTTTVNTATTSLPTYATACSNLPSKVSSACSCIAPSTPPHPACTPTPIVHNGGFNNPPISAGHTVSSEPPWAVESAISATVDYEGDVLSPGFHSGGFAAFNLVGQPYGSKNPQSTARIVEPITFCELAYYNISFAVRQVNNASQSCGIEIGWRDSNYGIVGYGLPSAWTLIGPTKFESAYVGDVPADNPDGSFNADLSVDVFCVGIKGVAPPATVRVDIDSLSIVPA